MPIVLVLDIIYYYLFLVTVTSPLFPLTPTFTPSIESTLQRGPVAHVSTPSVWCILWWGPYVKGHFIHAGSLELEFFFFHENTKYLGNKRKNPSKSHG